MDDGINTAVDAGGAADTYHVNCFVCKACGIKLMDKVYYNLNETPYCEECFNNTLEDCVVCKSKIRDEILKAAGNFYHPNCFTCGSCEKNLDGIPFTVDGSNNVLCVHCHQIKFCPTCAACDNLITSSNEKGEILHIVAMEKTFHIECYKCEDCQVILSSEEGRACYPLDGHLLCRQCNGIRADSKPVTQPGSLPTNVPPPISARPAIKVHPPSTASLSDPSDDFIPADQPCNEPVDGIPVTSPNAAEKVQQSSTVASENPTENSISLEELSTQADAVLHHDSERPTSPTIHFPPPPKEIYDHELSVIEDEPPPPKEIYDHELSVIENKPPTPKDIYDRELSVVEDEPPTPKEIYDLENEPPTPKEIYDPDLSVVEDEQSTPKEIYERELSVIEDELDDIMDSLTLSLQDTDEPDDDDFDTITISSEDTDTVDTDFDTVDTDFDTVTLCSLDANEHADFDTVTLCALDVNEPADFDIVTLPVTLCALNANVPVDFDTVTLCSLDVNVPADFDTVTLCSLDANVPADFDTVTLSSLDANVPADFDTVTLCSLDVNVPELFDVGDIGGNIVPCPGSGTVGADCLVCVECGTKLADMVYYSLNEVIYCETCYNITLTDCFICNGKIKAEILKAAGKFYHPQCFTCRSCDKILDGIEFTLDDSNTVLCVECYQITFCPICAGCENLITAANDQGEIVYIVSMEKAFHVECYKCKDCQILLVPIEDDRACYPLDGQLLCKKCNGIRVESTPATNQYVPPMNVPPSVSDKPAEEAHPSSTSAARDPSNHSIHVGGPSTQPLEVTPATRANSTEKILPSSTVSAAKSSGDSGYDTQQSTKQRKVPPPVAPKPTRLFSVDSVFDSDDDSVNVKQPSVQPFAPSPTPRNPSKEALSSIDVVDSPPFDFPPPPEELLMDEPITTDEQFDDAFGLLTQDVNTQDVNSSEFFGDCSKCGVKIPRGASGYTAVGADMYHVNCFICEGCGTKLTGTVFYSENKGPFCEPCNISNTTLDICVVCKDTIKDKMLKAAGNYYHPDCFACGGCAKNLDRTPFTLDDTDTVLCIECYRLKFSPRCAACENVITSLNEKGEVVHIVAMEKTFHIECYKCEDCQIILSSEQGRACYPLDGHFLCQQCNGIRRQGVSKQATMVV